MAASAELDSSNSRVIVSPRSVLRLREAYP
jgi:hypothetical protein